MSKEGLKRLHKKNKETRHFVSEPKLTSVCLPMELSYSITLRVISAGTMGESRLFRLAVIANF